VLPGLTIRRTTWRSLADPRTRDHSDGVKTRRGRGPPSTRFRARGVAELMRSAIALSAIQTLVPASLLRALEVYEIDRLEFAEAYLVAQAEATGVNEIVSLDRSIDRVATVSRREF
jgi:predicted nucleic acid-binding protein